MFHLDNQINDLWQGGPWEQPSPTLEKPPAVIIPVQGPRRPVLHTKKRSRRVWSIYAGLAALILVLCVVAAVVNRGSWIQMPSPFTPYYGYELPEEYSTEPPSIPRASVGTGVTVELTEDSGVPLTYTEIYEKNAPSIVSVEAESEEEYSSGTGIVLTADGYLLTNAHVVAGAEQVRVAFYDNRVLPASLVGFDYREDLAVLKVAAEDLVPAEFGRSDHLRCGDPVAALGDPLGYRSTITDGIVSALDREVEMDGITMLLIQTSAAINFGNSGGALINQYGQVVGITTIKIVTDDGSAEGLGFAIPSTRVKYVADALIDGREIRTGVFGFTVDTMPVEGGGLKLVSVDIGSDAWAKGLQAGDVLQTANGQPITGTRDLTRLKQTLTVGDAVTLTWLRDGEQMTADVILVAPDDLTGKTEIEQP